MLLGDGTPVRFEAPPKALALLGYLLLHRGHNRRGDVAFTLWPDHSEERALANLRRHLGLLSATLPPAVQWIEKTRAFISWDAHSDCSVDVWDFDAHDADEADKSIALYDGDLLEGFDEEWLLPHRERLRQRQFTLLDSLVTGCRSSGDYINGIEYAKRALRLDPWREQTLRALMHFHLDNSDRAGALDEYLRFAKRLKSELGIEPSLETKSTYETAFLGSIDTRPNNLPRSLTSFVGRETEINKITAQIMAHRLVTIIGSGGVGKTRTSLQVGTNLLESMRDGVWFVELAPLASGHYMPATISQAMAIPLGSEGDPLALLVAALKSKRALLIFDNCEHLVEPSVRVITALLRGCPQIKVLATTRQALGILGDSTYRMPSLAVPDVNPSLTASVAAVAPAVALFVERAIGANDRFVLTNDNASDVAEICRRLDGIALAIELAAARVKMLSPRQLCDRLDERFRVLTGGSRDVLPRQQTLRALIDWSYDLLEKREQMLFHRLAIFVNGFTIEGAVAVGTGDDIHEHDVFDLLVSLVDKSLLLVEPDGDAVRYRMLESTRAYALEKLDMACELSVSTTRHLRYLCHLFMAARVRLDRSGRQQEIISLVRAELEDIRVALDESASREPQTGCQLLVAVDDAWRRLGLESEGTAQLEKYIALIPSAQRALLSQLWTARANVAAGCNRARCLDAAARAVALAREVNEVEILSFALSIFGLALTRSYHFDEASAAIEEAQCLAPSDNAFLRLRLLYAQGYLSLLQGNFDEATLAYERLRIMNLQLGNTDGANVITLNLAETEHARGNTERAVSLVYEVLPAVRASRDRNNLVNCLGNLSGYLTALDRLPDARAAGCEALRISPESDRDGFLASIAIEHLALIAVLVGNVASGALLAGYVDAAHVRSGFRREYPERSTRARLEALLNERFGSDERVALFAQGAALSTNDAVAIALANPAYATKVEERFRPVDRGAGRQRGTSPRGSFVFAHRRRTKS